MSCTPAQLGYGTTGQNVHCALAHTGTSIVPFVVVGVLLIVLGVILRYAYTRLLEVPE
jgi:hypothetical protein